MLDKFFYGQARPSFGKFGSYAEYSLRLLSQVEPEHSVQSPFSWTRGWCYRFGYLRDVREGINDL